MFRTAYVVRNLLVTVCIASLILPTLSGAAPVTPAEPKAAAAVQDAVVKQATPNAITGQLIVTVGKSLIIDSPLNIKRVATANGTLVETMAIGPKEILINGKAAGETSLTIWQQDDTRLIYDLTVRISPERLNAVREQIARDYPDADINVTFSNETAFVRGTVKDVIAADRIMAIVGTMSKAISLLRVEVPPVEPQIMLKVRFANIDRTAKLQLGVNFTQPLGTAGVTGTGSAVAGAVNTALNVFTLRGDLNLLAQIQALEDKNLLEMLAEPNLLTFSGTRASFTAGGEFPYLAPQPSGGGVTFTVEFKEWGVRLNFLPRVTPQGTIHMQVNPEVSALDFANGVNIGGGTVPGLTTRKVTTEVDLESGQSFIVAGLLDKQITNTMSKIPGLSDIPVLGKFFQSKTISKSNSELMIIITPEIVRPIPANQVVPELKWTKPFMTDNSPFPMRQPSMDSTGPVPMHPPSTTLPLEQLLMQQKLVTSSPLTAPGPTAPATPPPAAAGPGGNGATPPAGGGGGAGVIK